MEIMYRVIYYESTNCCGAADEGEGWECGIHSTWRQTELLTKEVAEQRARHLPEGYAEAI